ncbi:hypothetical protein [Anabaena sp. 4-3]|uniref:hypothetical protein n=1 Tax=Anabaena sp. 4-3 TaxID=1811979 RepID=UPI000830DAF8|nr:hypothetical protein [Anabaena sp. 4-3]
MKEILALITTKKQEFAQLPLLKFMQDQSIDPRKRLAWGKCATPFIMGFSDLNKYGFRDLNSNAPIQVLINKHTEQDDYHWRWFLSDIEKLGFDCSLKFSDTVKFLWGEETKTPRWVINQLFRYALNAEPLQKLLIIEVLEITGNIVFGNAAQVAEELQAITGNKYLFFGSSHENVEADHIIDIENFLPTIELTEEQNQEALKLVEKIFELITELVNALFVYATNYDEQQAFMQG